MITKKNFFPTVCVVFTLILFGKLILEAICHYEDHYYFMNTICIMFFSLAGTFVLSLHNVMKDIPLLFVMILQYGLLIGLVMLFLFIGSFVEPVSEGGYADMFWSVSIPYFIGAVVYYICYFIQVKKANEVLREIRKK